jgi:hypothetical protein
MVLDELDQAPRRVVPGDDDLARVDLIDNQGTSLIQHVPSSASTGWGSR